MKINHSINYLFLLFILVSMNACEKEKTTSRDYPRIKTLDINQITSSGAKFNAEIFYNDGMNISDHGFVWGPSNSLALGRSESVSIGSFKTTGEFSYTGTYGMEAGTLQYVRAYLITEEYTVYGNLMHFISQGSDPHIIHDFTPKSASMMDIITISGQNFSSRPGGNIVQFGNVTATIFKNSNEQLKVLVPTGLNSANPVISVISSGHNVEATPSFNLLVPEFTDFSPKTAYIGQSITITGNNICPQTLDPNEVWFGDRKAIIQSASRKELVVEVPYTISSATEILRVVSFPTDIEFADSFQLGPPVINSFSPSSGGPGTQIAVFGKGFSIIRDNNEVRIGEVSLNISSVNNTVLVCYVPANPGLTTGDYKISVTTFGLTTESADYFHYIAP